MLEGNTKIRGVRAMKKKETVFTEKAKLIEYLEEKKEETVCDSIKIKLKGLQEVRNWVRVDEFTIEKNNLKVTLKCGHKCSPVSVDHIYPIGEIERARVIRHSRSNPPMLQKTNKSVFGLSECIVKNDLEMQSLGVM
jgi:hypothetical protein